MKNFYNHIHGFTLIEFMVAISIFFIISTASYIPYSHYQKKGLLNQGVKEISQSFYDARNMSINGLHTGTGNVSIGIFFDTSSGNNSKITYFSYPYNFTGTQIIAQDIGDIDIITEKNLPEGIEIDSIAGKSQFLAFFQSISGEGSYYYWDGGIRHDYILDEIQVNISYKGSSSPSLQKELVYYTKGNIADY